MIDKREIYNFYSDATGKQIDVPEHVVITYRDTKYVIDVDRANAKEELDNLTVAEAINAGRIMEPPRKSPRRKGRALLNYRVRQWALQQGIPVSDRGAVPKKIVESYLDVTGASPVDGELPPISDPTDPTEPTEADETDEAPETPETSGSSDTSRTPETPETPETSD